MATNKRSYPNTYFAWYNDDDKLAIITRVFTNDNTTDNTTSTDAYDTYSESTVASGIRISYHGRYKEAKHIEDDLKKDLGLAIGLQPYLVDYVKSRIEEDNGNPDKSAYFQQKYRNKVRTYPHRKSGTRGIKTPNL